MAEELTELEREIVRLRTECNLSYARIGERVGKEAHQIQYLVKRAGQKLSEKERQELTGIDRRRIPADILEVKERTALRLRKRRLSYREIGKEMNCSYQQAKDLIKRALPKLSPEERAELAEIEGGRLRRRYTDKRESYSARARARQQELGLSDEEVERIERLEAIMGRLNLTQKEIAGLIRVAPVTIGFWLRGEKPMPYRSLLAVEQATKRLKPRAPDGRRGNRRPFAKKAAKK